MRSTVLESAPKGESFRRNLAEHLESHAQCIRLDTYDPRGLASQPNSRIDSRFLVFVSNHEEELP
jgi:hypothetical protein